MAWCQTGTKPLPEPMMTQFSVFPPQRSVSIRPNMETVWRTLPSLWRTCPPLLRYSHSYNDVAWASWHLLSLTTQLFVHQLVQANSKEHQSTALQALCDGNRQVTSGFPSQRAINLIRRKTNAYIYIDILYHSWMFIPCVWWKFTVTKDCVTWDKTWRKSNFIMNLLTLLVLRLEFQSLH